MYLGGELMAGYNQLREFFEAGLEILNDSELLDADRLAKLEELFAKAVLPVETGSVNKGRNT